VKYTVTVAGEEITVDGIEFGMMDGSPVGNIDLYIRVTDSEEDIYTHETKSTFWVDWLNDCVGTTRKASEKIKEVVAKIYGGQGNQETFRTITIKNACIASYVESAGAGDYQYEVLLKKAPRKAKEDLVSVTSKWSEGES
jgi:hypothetical protein